MAALQNAAQFYENAYNAGIRNTDSAANIARLMLYAKNNNIRADEETLIRLFNDGKQEKDDLVLINEIKTLRIEETKISDESTKYSTYVGLEKPLAKIQEEIDYYTKIVKDYDAQIESVKNNAETLYHLSKGREKDWAIYGGAVSGIAGGAAGLATAIDIQQENATIRQQNADLAVSIYQLTTNRIKQIRELRGEASSNLYHWKKQADEFKMKLTDNSDSKELLSRLLPTITDAHLSLTGAIRAKLILHSTKLTIYDSVPAVVDGSIKVLLKANGTVVDTAVCVLPHGGLIKDITMDCVFTKTTLEETSYEFVFEPIHLWALEVTPSAARKLSQFTAPAQQNMLQAYTLTTILNPRHKRALAILTAQNKAEEERIAEENRKAAEQRRQQAEAQAIAEANAKKVKKIAMIITPIMIVAIVAAMIVSSTIKKNREEAIRLDAYYTAIACFEAGEYDNAITAFSALGDYKDSAEQVEKAKEAMLLEDYNFALALFESGQYDEAINAFSKLADFKDSKELLQLSNDKQTELYLENLRLTSKCRVLFSADGKENSRRTWTYSYNEDGLLLKATSTDYLDGTITYSYDDSGKLISSETQKGWMGNKSDGNTCIVITKYNEYGDPTTETTTYRCPKNWPRKDGEIETTTYKYEYYEDGTIKSQKPYIDGELSWRWYSYSYEYDTAGQLIKTQTQYHEDNYVGEVSTSYTYDDLGILISEKTVNAADNTLRETIAYSYTN